MRVKYKVVPQPEDGNCFFHAISFLLQRYEIMNVDHKKLRSLLSSYYHKKKNIKKSIAIAKDGVWADDEDVCATSHITGVNIRVWEGHNKRWITFGNYKSKIYIINKNNCHFESLIRLNE
tara:strand:+ start:11 stop:370 length:360 start_codon:yes stop_codon:yes gene_type:complete